MRFGMYIAKVGMFPVSPELTGLRDASVQTTEDRDALRNAVRQFFATKSALWELRVQLCTDLKEMPVEDSPCKWPEDKSPYRAVARITAQQQDSWTDDKVRRVDDGMAFSPWHGPGGTPAARVVNACSQGNLPRLRGLWRRAQRMPHAGAEATTVTFVR